MKVIMKNQGKPTWVATVLKTFLHSPFLYFKLRQSLTLNMRDLQKRTTENKTISISHNVVIMVEWMKALHIGADVIGLKTHQDFES